MYKKLQCFFFYLSIVVISQGTVWENFSEKKNSSSIFPSVPYKSILKRKSICFHVLITFLLSYEMKQKCYLCFCHMKKKQHQICELMLHRWIVVMNLFVSVKMLHCFYIMMALLFQWSLSPVNDDIISDGFAVR